MFNPLALKINNHIRLSTLSESKKELYICKEILNFTDAQKSIASRYQLFRESDSKEIWLEVKKDRALNYQLFYYEKVEELASDPSFLSIIGTSAIKYQNPHLKDSTLTLYNRVPKKGEVIMPIKHLIEEDDVPENPQEYGYFKDGNNNWYFMTKRSEGTLKNFDNNLKKRSWEYKHEHHRLLIEMQDESDSLNEITIYTGREIERKNLKKVALD